MGDVTPGTDADAAEARPERPGRRFRRIGLVGSLGLLLAILVVAALVYSLIELAARNSDADLRNGALAAANRYGVLVSSYDYRNLDGRGSAWSQVDADSTAKFRSKFDSTKASVGKLITDYKGTAVGRVVAGGISSAKGSRAVAVLFIDQALTNSTQKSGPTTEPLRVEMFLAHQGGHWLIDDVQVPR